MVENTALVLYFHSIGISSCVAGGCLLLNHQQGEQERGREVIKVCCNLINLLLTDHTSTQQSRCVIHHEFPVLFIPLQLLVLLFLCLFSDDARHAAATVAPLTCKTN